MLVTVNTNLIVQYVIQIKIGVMKHASVSVKIMEKEKKITTGIQANVFVKMISILRVLFMNQ